MLMAIDVLDVVPIEELRQHIEFDGDDRDQTLRTSGAGLLSALV